MLRHRQDNCGFAVFGASLLVFLFAAQPAQAQFWEQLWGIEPERPRKARPAQPRRAASPQQHETAAEPQIKVTQFPLVAVVSIASQRLAIYDSTGAVLHSRVSTGQEGHRTPLGVFKVIQKDRYHESNIYSGAPMPFMQRITWSGIAMHAGYLPGYPASHGCIRMPENVASDLFAATKLGMLVVISPSDVTAVSFTHPSMPTPLMLPASGTPAQRGYGQLQPNAPQPAPAVLLASSASDTDTVQGATLTNPHLRSVEQLPLARRAATEAMKSAKGALDASRLASAAATAAVADLKIAESDLASAVRSVAALRASAAAVASVEARAVADKAAAEAEARLVQITTRREQAKMTEAAKSQLAFDAAAAWRAADALVETTTNEAKKAAKAVEPLSVFISRKEGRLFARQGFTPMFDGPVTFKGEIPLGTHVYTAMAADEKTGQLSWQSISVPTSANAERTSSTRQNDRQAPQITNAPATAADALDRIELDPALRQKLSERVWLGASLIISDYGLGQETGTDTDFVVLTR